MKRTILTNERFCAVLEDGKLMEYLPKESGDQSGEIVLGKIDRMMPGLRCAFVDIGRKRDGFLPTGEESESFTGPAIRSGEMAMLQIKKEETGGKGAFLTRDLTFPGKLLILMPMNRYIGVSSRIDDEGLRERLKQIGREVSGGRFGMILRNAAADADEALIREEAEILLSRWEKTEAKAKQGGKPGTVLYRGDETERLTEDYAATGVQEVLQAAEDDAGIRRQLKQASERILRLPGGGNIVIDRCEAMTVIDVNTASAEGSGSTERTFTETNLEACALIAQQVRLRNLSGIILIDFIDMDLEKDRSMVFDRLTECFSYDRVKTVIHGWTRLGLMEMTRKRSRAETGVLI